MWKIHSMASFLCVVRTPAGSGRVVENKVTEKASEGDPKRRR